MNVCSALPPFSERNESHPVESSNSVYRNSRCEAFMLLCSDPGCYKSAYLHRSFLRRCHCSLVSDRSIGVIAQSRNYIQGFEGHASQFDGSAMSTTSPELLKWSRRKSRLEMGNLLMGTKAYTVRLGLPYIRSKLELVFECVLEEVQKVAMNLRIFFKFSTDFYPS